MDLIITESFLGVFMISLCDEQDILIIHDNDL
jgi:hypothetical protein